MGSNGGLFNGGHIMIILPIEGIEATFALMPVVGILGALAIGGALGIGSSLLERSTSRQGGPVQLPGLIPKQEGAGFLRQAIGAAGQPSPFNSQIQSILNPQTSAFAGPLQDAILNPSFAPQGANQQNLINQILAQRQGQFNALGIGSAPGTQAAVAASAAPALAQFQQQNVSNLAAGRELDFAGQRLNLDVFNSLSNDDLQRLQVKINTLLRGAQFGQTTTAQQPGRAGFDLLGSALGGASAGLGVSGAFGGRGGGGGGSAVPAFNLNQPASLGGRLTL